MSAGTPRSAHFTEFLMQFASIPAGADFYQGGLASHTTEIFTGMCFLAVMTGLVFARFSRPRARFVFAKNPVITRHEGRQR
jgi:hypothetical protein